MQTEPLQLHVSVKEQRLTLREGDRTLRSYPVSTSRFGLGCEEGSQRTPLGRFQIGEKIGSGAAPGTVFKSRQPVPPGTRHEADDDLIMSRILWLDGLEEHNANTRERFIYIHGTNHEEAIGEPASHGCIRMRNADLVELFDLVPAKTPVLIEA